MEWDPAAGQKALKVELCGAGKGRSLAKGQAFLLK
jgi:hypothetical protein